MMLKRTSKTIRIAALTLLIGLMGMNSATAQTVDQSAGLNPPLAQDTVLYFQVVPDNTEGNVIDGLFALSEGPVSAYNDCSTILRFNGQAGQYLDVYDGGYTQTNQVPITFGQTYHCWFAIDFEGQSYDTYVLTADMTEPTLIHGDAAFRKTNVGSLALWNSVHYAGSSANVLKVKSVGYVDAVGDMVVDYILLSTAFGELNESSIDNIPPSLSVSEFVDGLNYFQSATISLKDESGNDIAINSSSYVTTGMTLVLTGVEASQYDLNVRDESSDNELISAFDATLDHSNGVISGLYNNLTLQQFKTGINIPQYATVQIVNAISQDEETDPSLIISSSQELIITAENGDTKTYSIITGSNPQPAKLITNSSQTFHNIHLERYNLGQGVEWHIKATDNPLPGSILNIINEDVWLYFEGIRPQRFFDNFLSSITVNGEPAELDVNMRLVQYANGCVVIGHSENYSALTVFADADLSGSSMQLDLHTYYRTTQLGSMADNVESFVLKKGYMASFSENTDGTGYSKVFIADKEDIVMTTMPTGLSNSVSFIRVFPWRWTNKKGYDGSPSWGDDAAAASWTYSHGGNSHNSSLNVEFVPLRHNPGWPSYSEIQAKENSTHALFFNEPNNEVDDGYSTVENAIAQYPNLLASGLRMVSPAPTDGGAWWIYEFLEQCKAKNYRVDAVAIHFYRGCQSTANFYNFLKEIHDNTGLPIWITEWANGCNWTSCNPTSYEENANVISEWVKMLEAAPFVERYVMWHGCTQYQQFFKPDGSRSPAGQFYHDYQSNLAYSTASTHNFNPFPADKAVEIEPKIELSWNKSPGTEGQMLYFGDADSPAFKAYLTPSEESYELEELEYGKTYYWRVDEYKNGQWETGEEWEFNTIAFVKPYGPAPENESEGVMEKPVLSWTSDTLKSELHRLYMGLNPEELEFTALLPDTLTSFESKTLTSGKTYYWRVDEHLRLKNGRSETIVGDMWEFTVGSVLEAVGKPVLKAWPVPVINNLKLEGLKPNSRVEVFNMIGAKVLTAKYSGLLDLQSLPNGMYIIRTPNHAPLKIIKQ